MKNGDMPANPQYCAIDTSGDVIFNAQEGLTKREQFAAMAMQGLLGLSIAEWIQNKHPIATLASQAVEVADALLQELDK